jgi:hypothetical protein
MMVAQVAFGIVLGVTGIPMILVGSRSANVPLGKYLDVSKSVSSLSVD